MASNPFPSQRLAVFSPAFRFGGVYRVDAITQGQRTVNTEDLPPEAHLDSSPEASYGDNPELVGWRQMFLALQRLGAQGMAKGAFVWLDEPDSRVYSPEDVDGPYLYSRRHYVVCDDALGNHLTQYLQGVEGPSVLARQADRRAIGQGRLQKAPPGYGTRRSLLAAYLNGVRAESIPASLSLSVNGTSAVVTPLVESRPPFVLEA